MLRPLLFVSKRRTATTSEICDVTGEHVRALAELWHDMRIYKETMGTPVRRIQRDVVNLFKAMRHDMEEMKERILRHISSYTSEVERLASDLAVPVTLVSLKSVLHFETSALKHPLNLFSRISSRYRYLLTAQISGLAHVLKYDDALTILKLFLSFYMLKLQCDH